MGLVFATMGGSGSEHLVASLERAGYRVGRRVDAPWLPIDKPCEHKTPHQHIRSLDEKPTAAAMGEFARRGGATQGAATVSDLFQAEVDGAQATSGRAVILVRAHMHGFYSQAKPKGIVFLVRHPRHAYLSHCQPDRHGAEWRMVGYHTRASIRLFAGEWMALVEQYLSLRDAGCKPILARFEDCAKVFVKDRVLRRVFRRFEGRGLNRNPLAVSLDGYLRLLCAAGYAAVYPDIKW